MKTVGVRDLKNRLSEYLRMVRSGESVLITDRGEVIAELNAPGRGGIAAAAREAGVLIVGLSERWREDGLGATRSGLLAAPPCPLVFAARGPGPGALRPPAPLTRFPWSVTRRILPG